MINFDHRAFIDELQKLAVKLTPEEERRQMYQFAGLGAVAAPAVTVGKNLIQYGKVSPFAPVPRMLAANAIGGALGAGLVPVVRHGMERQMQEEARERRRAERALSEKNAELTRVKSAGRLSAELAPSIAKAAMINATSRDNRTPWVGGTQFPTEGSKQKAKQFHAASVGKAEVGPAPLMGSLDKTKMVPLASVTPKMPTAKGSLPYAGGTG